MNVSAPAWAPACMDPDEWALWERANRSLSSPFDRAARPCADCPLGHAADMRAEGRCNGTPGGVDEEEPMDDVRTRVEAAATAKVAIALTAPCGPCGHAPVCRLRESVEATARTTVAVPKLEPGLAVELRGTIACEWFVKARNAPTDSDPRPRREMTPEQREAARERMLHARAIGVARKAAAGS